ncbi:hypothetical protein Bequi_13605 [Brachybacterium sp. JHP9]|uniref:Uncharacterized protein n=1 Tax=Brachybacterium equifaecis TaxID=2910770 RepID=A0ABT0R3P8_9MICO|nr:hypothetical protein [Brachybacterium equifaecis]MCL6424400.1 hypothetical protein [Brachybacterium equifaecis]
MDMLGLTPQELLVLLLSTGMTVIVLACAIVGAVVLTRLLRARVPQSARLARHAGTAARR